MGRVDITMPQLGETVTEGTISLWLKAVGDLVKVGEAVLEVSTDKVDTEIVSPADGVLSGPLTPEGDTVPVGTVIAGISSDAPVPAASGGRHAGRALLSPRVRRLAADHSVDHAGILGTGAGGRVTGRDVDAHLDSVRSTTATAPDHREPDEKPDEAVPAGATPMSRVRRITAERTLESLRTSAHVLSVVEVDYTNVDRVRNAIKAQWKDEHGFSLSYLPFICRAVIDSLRQHPALNASVVGEAIVQHPTVDLGIAVDLGERGLVVPLIRGAHDRRLAAIARDVSALAEGARGGTLAAEQFAPGTFTITNNGSAGSVLTAPIIVQPQVAILSTDAIVRRVVPIRTEDGEVLAVHNVGILALSWDHR
ncbi:MAG: hypothetical protein QOI74_2022, partial [Micromonosporaceae bacterium]|nr:hypothetical protein [Micromonosporaceae bacterium]